MSSCNTGRSMMTSPPSCGLVSNDKPMKLPFQYPAAEDPLTFLASRMGQMTGLILGGLKISLEDGLSWLSLRWMILDQWTLTVARGGPTPECCSLGSLSVTRYMTVMANRGFLT